MPKHVLPRHHAPARPEAGAVGYRIDRQDRIQAVDPAWAAFARANGAPDLADDVLGRSLWEFITDRTTVHLYRLLLARCRTGGRITVPFRCDAPHRRRFMELELIPGEDDAIDLRSRLVAQEERPLVALLRAEGGASPEPDATPVVMCGWCKRLPVGERWVEVEEAVEELKLFSKQGIALSHGICPECEAEVLSRATEDGA